MSSPNFGAILDTPSQEIERPKPLPQGTYTCVVNGLPRMDKSAKKGTEFVEFNLNILAAGEDVDEDALGEMGGIAGKSTRVTFYLTESSVWRLKKFLVDDLGIEEEDDLTLRGMISMAPGRQVLAHIKHTPSDDGTSVFANVASTAPVE
jgi:hypothetical protein